MNDAEIIAACELHGAKTVSDAAYKRIAGDHTALPKVGLQACGIGEADRITAIAFRLMSAEERAMDLTEATITGAKLP
jgi:hypothetical protein